MTRDYIYNNFTKTCPICGKEFSMYDPEIWAYRDWRHYYCSWKCLCEANRRKKDEHAAVMAAKAERDRMRATNRTKTGLPGLRAIRNAKGLTQQELAIKAGVCVNTIAFAEKGSADPKPAKVKRLCEALGCTEEDLRRIK